MNYWLVGWVVGWVGGWVGYLEMRPGRLEDWVVFFWVEVFRLRRKRTADVGGHAGHDVCIGKRWVLGR